MRSTPLPLRLFAPLALLFAVPLGPLEAAPIEIAAVSHDGPVDFEKEILPLLRRNCLACHNATEAEGELVLESPGQILKGGVSGPAVVAGKSAESLLLLVASHAEEPVMPPKGNDVGAKNLKPQELGLIKLWIDQGAKGEVSAGGVPLVWRPVDPAIGPVYAVDVTPDGRLIAASRANQVFLYHAAGRHEVGRLSDPALTAGELYPDREVAHLDLVQAVAFDPQARRLATAGYRTVKIWSRPENAKLGEIGGIGGEVLAQAVSPDGRLAAIARADGKVQVLDLAEKKSLREIAGHEGPVRAVAFSANGELLATGGEDKSLQVWSTADGAARGRIDTPAPVTGAAFVLGDAQVATGHADNMIRAWLTPGTEVPAEEQAAEEKAAEEKAAEGEEPAEPEPPKPVKEIGGHGGPITCLLPLDAEGKQLGSGSQDGTFRVWDAAGGNQIRQMAHGGPVLGIAVSPDGQRFASAGANNSGKLWDAAGQQKAELKGDFRAVFDLEEARRALALAQRQVKNAQDDLKAAQDRKKSEEDNQKKAMEALTKAEAEFKAKDEAAKKPVADKEEADKALAAALETFAKAEGEKTAAEEAAAKAAEELKKAQEARAALNEAGDDEKKKADDAVQAATTKKQEVDAAKQKADQAFNEANNAKNQAEQRVKQLEAPAQKALDEKNSAQRAHEAAMRSVQRAEESVKAANEAVPANEKTLKDREAQQAQAQQGVEERQKSVPEKEKPLAACAFSADGRWVAFAGEDGVIRTYTVDGAPADTFEGGSPVLALAYGPTEGNSAGGLAALTADKKLTLWDPAAPWSLERTIGGPESSEFVDRVTALHFSPDGKLLATGGGEPSRSGEVKIWNVENGSLAKALTEPHSDAVCGVEFSPSGNYLATAGSDRFMKVWDWKQGTLVKSYEGHTHHVLGVSWQQDERVLASCGADNVVKVWNFVTGDQIRTIGGFGKEVTSVRFVSDPAKLEWMVCAGGDKQVRTAVTNNNSPNRSFGGSADFVYMARVTADGKTIIAGGEDGVIRLWNLDNAQVLGTIEPPSPKGDEVAAGGE